MAGSVNRVMILGRLGKDPEIRTVEVGGQQKPVCTFSVATSDKRGGKEETTWFDVVSWEKTAENCARYLTKGREVFVEGRVKVRHWEKDGVKHRAWDVVAERVTFIGTGKKDDAPSGKDRAAGEPEPAPADVDLDSIPF